MLDTSDKQLFVSGYDPSMGTTGFETTLSDQPTLFLVFDSTRRQFVVRNGGNATAYINFITTVSMTAYAVRLRPNAFLAMSDYGGVVTGICDSGLSTTLYVIVTK